MIKGYLEMLDQLGVSLKHTSAVPAARILVIEDNSSDVFLLDRALKKQDLQFELVHLLNGGEGLAFIRRQGPYADAAIPNLILVDLNLSRYTGEDILREIRSVKHLAGVPVCVWSSSRSRRDEALLKDLGVSQFISKPSGVNQFMEIGKIIKDLLAGARVADGVTIRSVGCCQPPRTGTSAETDA
jgi:DNA-binding response OmpR family regulator